MVISGCSSEENGEAPSQLETDPLLLTPAVVIDIKEDLVLNSLVTMLKDDLSEPLRDEPCTIYKVLHTTRKEDPGAYEPQVVSIGPFHRQTPHLLPMERIKRQFLRKLISRDPSNKLEKYVKEVSALPFIEKINKCYSEQVIGPDGGNALVEMMVLDGCFIIEFIVKSVLGEKLGELEFVNWNRTVVDNDLLLIENQIPFFVLQTLYDSTCIPGLPVFDPPITLAELALSCISKEKHEPAPPIPKVIHHLLHLRHSSLHPSPKDTSTKPFSVISWSFREFKNMLWNILIGFLSLIVIVLTCGCPRRGDEVDRTPRTMPSATELDEAGIDFEIKKNASCILDVTFRLADGVMEIPLLSIQAASVSEFRNLVAFEQGCPDVKSLFTAYVALMDNLIDTPEDVALLENRGVLESKLGGDEEVASFFNSLGKGACLDYKTHYLVLVFEEVKKYCATKRHRWRARMVRDYFSNPWSAISVVAAVFLLGLTVLQSVYAILAYVNR